MKKKYYSQMTKTELGFEVTKLKKEREQQMKEVKKAVQSNRFLIEMIVPFCHDKIITKSLKLGEVFKLK